MPDRWYWTSRVLVNEAALSQIVEETSWVVNDLIRAEANERFPRNLQEDRGYLSCGKCEFEPLCSAELGGLDTRHILDDYEDREEKNPYEEDDNGEA